MHTPRWQPSSLSPRALTACAAGALISLMAAGAGMLWQLHQDATRHAQAEVTRIAAILAQTVVQSIEPYDAALRAAADALSRPAIRDLPPPQRDFVLFDRLGHLSHVSFMEALDANGDVIASLLPGQRATNWANRDYFLAQRHDSAQGLYISRPFATALPSSATVALSRRVLDEDGHFAGAVVLGLRLAYFQTLLGSLDLGRKSTLTLARDDGTILLQWPALPAQTDAARYVAERTLSGPAMILRFAMAGQSSIAAWAIPPLAGAVLVVACTALTLLRLQSEVRRRQAAEHDSQGKSSLIATLSHELRTPLHGILGNVEQLLTDGILDPTQSHRVRAIADAGQHMSGIVDLALDQAWIEARGPGLHLSRFDLPQLLTECCAIVEPSAQARGLTLAFIQAPDAPLQCVADAGLLRQIVLNLLQNAVKFTRTGGIEVRLGTAASGIMVEVADTGIGVSAERRTHLFHDYDRLGAEYGEVAGTGLGLAIASRLARRMGGDIAYHDNRGGGSVFRVRLPDGAEETPEPPPSPATQPVARHLRVLVVDDDRVCREIAVGFLRAAGHTVLQASDGVGAVQLVASQRLDAVLLDMRMSGIDGLETARRIRAIGPPHGAVPIIAMTANALEQHVEACLRAGMQAHLAKPFSSGDLATALARATGVRPLLDTAILAQLMQCMDARQLRAHLQELTQRVATLLQVIETQGGAANDDLLHDLAHRLAGSAGSLGLSALSSVARRLADTLAAGDRPGEALLGETRRTAEGALTALRAQITALDPRSPPVDAQHAQSL